MTEPGEPVNVAVRDRKGRLWTGTAEITEGGVIVGKVDFDGAASTLSGRLHAVCDAARNVVVRAEDLAIHVRGHVLEVTLDETPAWSGRDTLPALLGKLGPAIAASSRCVDPHRAVDVGGSGLRWLAKVLEKWLKPWSGSADEEPGPAGSPGPGEEHRGD